MQIQKFPFYAAVMVGKQPCGLSISLEDPPRCAEDVLKVADLIRQQMMVAQRRLDFPAVVILNLVPFETVAKNPVINGE